jgi:SNF2 family DNA or RNA helicase
LELLTRLKTLTLFPSALLFPKKVQKSEEQFSISLPKSSTEILTKKEKQLIKNLKGTKIEYLLKFCSENSESSILIFSSRSATFLEPLYSYLLKEFKEIGLITGSISLKERLKLVNSFQRGEIKILLCNIQSAGVGLNLSQADIVIFADRAWSPAENEQAEDRFLPTQTEEVKPKLVIDLILKNSLDEKVMKLLKRKKNITKLVINNPRVLL